MRVAYLKAPGWERAWHFDKSACGLFNMQWRVGIAEKGRRGSQVVHVSRQGKWIWIWGPGIPEGYETHLPFMWPDNAGFRVEKNLEMNTFKEKELVEEAVLGIQERDSDGPH